MTPSTNSGLQLASIKTKLSSKKVEHFTRTTVTQKCKSIHGIAYDFIIIKTNIPVTDKHYVQSAMLAKISDVFRAVSNLLLIKTAISQRQRAGREREHAHV
jgi:hypothetical protein